MIANSGLGKLTMGFVMKNQSDNYPERLCVADMTTNKKYTYAQFNKRINKLANGLLAKGVKKGDILTIYMSDCLEWYEIMFAVNKIGAVWSPCNFCFTAKEVLTQVAHTEPKWFFCGDASIDVIDYLKEKLPSLEHYAVFTDRKDPRWHCYESLLEEMPDTEPEFKDISPEDMVGIIYTSGTTGIPKGAMHTHQTLLGWAAELVFDCGLVREDNMLNPYPLFHLGGIIVGIATFFAGGANVMLGKFEPIKFLETVETQKITIFCAVPTIVHAVVSLPEETRKKYAMKSVRKCYTSSAPLLQSTKEAWFKAWPHIETMTSYTTTETWFTSIRHQDQLRKVMCVGRPSFGEEIKILDEDGNEAPQGEPGLVYGRGVSCSIGYYKNEEADKKAFRGEWLTCEDIGYLDNEGFLYLVDRAKDMVITGGEKVASIEVENLLVQHGEIHEAAVVGEKDERWGEKVHAFVVLKPESSLTPEKIIDWCKQQQIAGYKVPKAVTIIDALPKTPVGKILKKELREKVNAV